MISLENRFVALCRWGVGLAFSVLIITVLIQVLGRTFAASPVWTEELTRFALLYMAAFGAGLSLRTGELVNVDIVCEALGGKASIVLRFISLASVVVLCAMLLAPAWKYVSIGKMQTSPALGLRMDFVHGSVFLLLLVLMIIACVRATGILMGSHNGLPVQSEEVN